MNITQFDRKVIRQSLQVRFTALINKVLTNQKWDSQKITDLYNQIESLISDCKDYGLEDEEVSVAYNSLVDIRDYLKRKYFIS